jgi:hypothetical protein
MAHPLRDDGLKDGRQGNAAVATAVPARPVEY